MVYRKTGGERETTKLKKVLLAVVLAVIVIVAFSVAWLNSHISGDESAGSSKPLLVGVETGWDSNVSDCKALIDRVKSYTNLLIIASPLILSDEELLNETCDYAYSSGMFIIVYFDDLTYSGFFATTSNRFTPSAWFTAAKERYGDRMLGIYFSDERGGRLLDQRAVELYPPDSYEKYADRFLQTSVGVKDTASFVHNVEASIFTSDYALYWFDYRTGYDVVLAQLGWNNSRALQIALTRGAATVQGKDWGVIVTWTYNQAPYLETGAQLYDDKVLAYDSGAKYVAIYDSSQGYQNTTLKEEHFDALKRFWSYTQNIPRAKGGSSVYTALVLPRDYGFGFRYADDSVWGVKRDDNWTRKLFSDVTTCISQANSTLDMVYADPEFQSSVQSKYRDVLYWPKDFETDTDYPVVNLNSGFGYDTIQEAISSYATCNGDPILVKPGTCRENVVIMKSVTLVSQNTSAAIIDGMSNGTAVTIAADNVTLKGFAVENGGNFTAGMGGGILLNNAHNCSLVGNTVANSYEGIVLTDSSNNVLRNNSLSNNGFNFGVSASNLMNPQKDADRLNIFTTSVNKSNFGVAKRIENYLNDIDSSNTVNGKPIYYWINKTNMEIPSDAGFVALINCTNIKVQNLNLSNNYEGLLLANVEKSAITNNIFRGNYEGVILDTSSDNTLKGNHMAGNTFNFVVVNALPNDVDMSNLVDGKPIYFWVSRSNQTVPTDAGYVALINCSNITVQNLHLENNGQGILLSGTSNISVTNNVIMGEMNAVELTEASSNTIAQNQISGNTASGIFATLSNGNILVGNNLSGNEKAVLLRASSDNSIRANNITANNFGIWLENNTVSNATGNIISSNVLAQNNFGVDVEQGAENNTACKNNFLNNTEQVCGYGMTRTSTGGFGSITFVPANIPKNSWDNGTVGNYWSDYTGADANHDGIGDDPYSINSANSDNHPVMKPFATN